MNKFETPLARLTKKVREKTNSQYQEGNMGITTYPAYLTRIREYNRKCYIGENKMVE